MKKTAGAIFVDETGATSLPRVFAGGDIVSQPRTVSHAIGAGKKAAMAMDASFRGKDVAEALRAARWGEKGSLSMARYLAGEADGTGSTVVKFSDLNPAYFQRRRRKAKENLPASERASDFREINVALSPADALEEAKRCFNCGVCNLCDNCFIFCPDMAVAARPDKKGYEINLEYCKGCCICVAECPRGAISVEVRK